MSGKLRVLDILLESPSAVFYAGTFIGGTVLIELAEPMKIRGVRLGLTGRASVHWTEQRSRYVNNQTQHYTVSYDSSETYINQEVVMWGHPSSYSGETPEMPAGQHRFQFQFQIPPNCPTSFEGGEGNIRYVMKVTLDKPWKFDHTAKRPITVIGIVDLNNYPGAANPVQNTDSKTLGCCCCEAGIIALTMKLPRGGFVAGESIPLEVQLTNNSTREMKRLEVKFVKTETFRAEGHSRTHTNKLAQFEQQLEMPAGESKTFQFPNIRIPAVPPILPTCSIIQNYYTITVELVPHGPSTSLDVSLPVIIGTIPLRAQFAQMMPTAPPQSMPMMAGGSVQPSAPPILPKQLSEQYPDLPPPSYEESIGGRTNIRESDDNEHTRGQMEFAPRYPYYNTGAAGVAPAQVHLPEEEQQ